MPSIHPRIRRERSTITAMIHLYCHDLHGSDGQLCPECADLHEYTQERLRRCPFQENKSTCANCTVHCYKPEMRARVQAMMRYAGPRMLLRHPFLTLWHLLDALRKPPVLNRSNQDSV